MHILKLILCCGTVEVFLYRSNGVVLPDVSVFAQSSFPTSNCEGISCAQPSLDHLTDVWFRSVLWLDYSKAAPSGGCGQKLTKPEWGWAPKRKCSWTLFSTADR